MDDITDLYDTFLKNTVSGWLGNHECRHFIGVLLSQFTQLINLNIPVIIAGQYHYFHTRHYS